MTTLIEKYSDLTVYNNILKHINDNISFYDEITECSFNKDKSETAKSSIRFITWYLIHAYDSWTIDDLIDSIIDETNDGKIDAILKCEGNLHIIQCKFWQYPNGYNNSFSDIETTWKKITKTDGESFDNANDRLKEKMPLIDKYYQDENRKIVLCFVTPTDITNADKPDNDWTKMKKKIEKNTKFKVELINCDDLRFWSEKDDTELCKSIV